MRLLGSHVWRARATALVGALTIGAVAAVPLGAQVERPGNVIQNSDGSNAASITRGKGFNLFGSGDIATTGMKQVGQQGWGLTNYGPCGGDAFAYAFDCGHVIKDGVWRSKYFEVTLIAGAGRADFRKIRNVYPQIGASALGGGYTYIWNNPLLQWRGEIAPSDNSLGTIFSGAQSTEDGSCQDISSAQNGYHAAGNTLLAMSDCPVTWGPAGFLGPRFIPDTAFRNLKAALGDDFNWQYWGTDPAQRGGNLGNFSTFGNMTDYTTEILDSYGSATPRSTRAPTIDGYPLGLDIRMEAASFSLPSLANAVLYQLTVVNNSANVYGTGIDYDSLYMGLEMGFYDPTQQSNTYWEPHRNAVMSANRGIHAACNGTRRVNPGTPACGINGFDRGAVGAVFLKSPIGDMRNKLYTSPGMFNDPSNAHAGDTITMNHGHKCGYGSCLLNNVLVNSKRLFGLLSSKGDLVLDGRSVNDLTATEYYYAFRNWDFPNRPGGRFNQFSPAGWDFDHDGVQDTIFFDTCDESVNNTLNIPRGAPTQCVSTWSDSMPGGFTNAYGNVGGVAAAGPFALKAGDTTSFVIAFTGAPDSAGIEAITDNVIANYLAFWAGPTPPPAPRIISTNVTRNSVNQPVVEITYSDAPEVWVDPFLMKYADDLENSTAPDQILLRTLNPNLVDQIRARAAAGMNFKTLYVYKSCNGGATFTSDADCVGDPAVSLNGQSIGNGWQPYAIINATADGQITNVFRDQNVIAGRTYLYSFITQSRGFSTIVFDSIDGELVSRTLVVADSLLAPVPTSGPNVATVYVPISFAAGTTPNTFTFTRSGTPTTLPVLVQLSNAAQGGTYQAIFGNRFIVVDSVDVATGTTRTNVTVQTYYADAVDANGDPIAGGVAATSQTFSGTGPIGIGGGLSASPDSTVNASYVVRTDTLDGLAFLFTRDGQPLFISAASSIGETTPTSFFGNALYPGFTVSFDTSRVAKFTTASEFAVKPPADTLPAGVFSSFGVNWAESKSVYRAGGGGQYEVTFADDAYGPNAPFTINVNDAAGTAAAVNASIAARDNPTTADTSAATVAAVQGILAGRALVPAKLPFTVRNVTFDRAVTVAMMRRRDATANTVLLGGGSDTVRVTVDSLSWLPGDTLAFLETVSVDSTIGGAVVINPATNAPFQVQRTIVTIVPAIMECSGRVTCNPVRIGTPGASGYLTYVPGTKLFFTYEAGFVPGSQFTVNVQATVATGTFSAADRKNIRVVPNPYIVQGAYDVIDGRVGTSRVYFSGVPTAGQLRIYSVSGQFLQQLDWVASDLNGTGDLPYDLRTREGTDLASGLYIWTIRANDENGKSQLARGKFVVIR